MDEITPVFKKLPIATPDEISDDEFRLLEFFVVRLYSKPCNTKEVNETRGILLSRDYKVIENIRPTKGALRQHVLRSVLQSSKWQQSLCKDFDGWDACQWGWQKVKNEMIPLCRELGKYGCKREFTGRCKCLKSDLKCIELCQCFG